MRKQTSAEVGQALGLAPATVQKYARDGRIPFNATPGGHRRFDVEEVRAALYGATNMLRGDPLPIDGGLGTGAPVTFSAAALTERDTRALVALAAIEDNDGRSALEDLFDHARRVFVTTTQ